MTIGFGELHSVTNDCMLMIPTTAESESEFHRSVPLRASQVRTWTVAQPEPGKLLFLATYGLYAPSALALSSCRYSRIQIK